MGSFRGVVEGRIDKDEHDHDREDPCKCAPGDDKEIIFNRDTCLSTDPRFLWDYEQGLLSIDGRLAASGYISSSSQVEGAYLAPMTLGLASFNFTPPAGYGGIVYRGGSIFYYWNNTTNHWEAIDFSGGAANIDLSHNGVYVLTTQLINFVDTPSAVWAIGIDGSLTMTVTGVGTWNQNQNANGFGIYNLTSINGVPMANFLTTTWSQAVNANGHSLSNVSNLSVTGTITYQGQDLASYIRSLDLWSLAADGSIYRDSRVSIIGTSFIGSSISDGPLLVRSLDSSNYLLLDTTSAAGSWSAFAGSVNYSTYTGEIGFGDGVVEVWTSNSMIFQGTDTGTSAGNVRFPGFVNIGSSTNTPAPLHVTGSVSTPLAQFYNSSSVNGPYIRFVNNQGQTLDVRIGGATASISNQANNGILLASRDLILGSSGVEVVRISDAGFVGIGKPIPQYSLNVIGNVNSTSCYLINGIAFACTSGVGSVALTNISTINGAPPGGGGGGGGSQTPWESDINGNGFNLFGANNLNITGQYLVNGVPIGTGNPAPPNQGVQYNNNGVFAASSNFTWDNSNAFLTISSPYTTQSFILNSTAAPDANTTQQIVFQKLNFDSYPFCLIQCNCSDVGTIDLDIIMQPDGGGTALEVATFRQPTLGVPWAVLTNGAVNVSSGTGAGPIPDANTANSHLIVGDTRAGTTYGEVTVYGSTTTSGNTFGSINFANYSRSATEKRMGVISGVLTSSGSNYGGLRFQTMNNQTLDPIGIYLSPSNAGTSFNMGTMLGGQSFNIYRTIGAAGIYLQTDSGQGFGSTIWGNSYGGASNTSIGLKIMGQVGRGTLAAPIPVQAGDVMVRLEGWGQSAGGGEQSCLIQMMADGNWSLGTGLPSAIAFYTTETNAILERMRITSAGNVGIGTATPVTQLHVYNATPGQLTTLLLEQGATTGSSLTEVALVAHGVAWNVQNRGTWDTPNDRFSIIYQTMNPTEAFTILPNGNVGIGINSPNFFLDVAGDCNISGVYRINGVPLAIGQTPWTSNIDAARFNLSNLGTTTWVSPNGNFSCNLSVNSVGNVTFDGTGGNGLNFYSAAIGLVAQSGQLVMQADGSVNGVAFRIATTSVTNVLCVTPTGNVGINTANPTSTLDVYGSTITRADANNLAGNPGLAQLQMGGLTNPNQRLYMGFDTTNNVGVIQPGVALVGWNNLILNPAGGNVGIGTVIPAYKLDVRSGSTASQVHVSATNTDDGGYLTSVGPDSFWMFGGLAYNGTQVIAKATNAGAIYIINGLTQFVNYSPLTVGQVIPSGGALMTIYVNGVGIGGPSGAGAGLSHVFEMGVDDAAKPGTNTWTIASDVRTKRNVNRFEGDIEVIRKLNPTVSEYNGKAGTPKGLRVVSFDPDELKAVVPQCVSYVKAKLNPDDEKEIDLAGINIHEIFFHLLRAVQNIDARLAKLENSKHKK